MTTFPCTHGGRCACGHTLLQHSGAGDCWHLDVEARALHGLSRCLCPGFRLDCAACAALAAVETDERRAAYYPERRLVKAGS